MKNWTVLEDGGSGRWMYARSVGAGAYVFLAIDDMVDCCGRDADYYFHATVSVVDVVNTDTETVASALRSCGAESWMDDIEPARRPLCIAQCMHDYGARAPMWDEGSPAIDKEKKPDWKWQVPSDRSPQFLRLRAAARRWAEENLLADESREKLLDSTIVNPLGQTARQYAQGTAGLWDRLRAIREAGDDATPEQRLSLRMYQKAGQTLGAGPVPSDIMSDS